MLLAMPPRLADLLSRDGGGALARSELPAASRRYRHARGTACMASPPSGGGPSNGDGSASKRSSTSTYRDGPAPMPTSKGFPLPAHSSFLSFEDLHERHPHAPIGHNARVGSANFSQRLLQGEQILQSYLSGRVHQVGPSFARYVLSFMNRAGPALCQSSCPARCRCQNGELSRPSADAAKISPIQQNICRLTLFALPLQVSKHFQNSLGVDDFIARVEMVRNSCSAPALSIKKRQFVSVVADHDQKWSLCLQALYAFGFHGDNTIGKPTAT